MLARPRVRRLTSPVDLTRPRRPNPIPFSYPGVKEENHPPDLIALCNHCTMQSPHTTQARRPFLTYPRGKRKPALAPLSSCARRLPISATLYPLRPPAYRGEFITPTTHRPPPFTISTNHHPALAALPGGKPRNRLLRTSATTPPHNGPLPFRFILSPRVRQRIWASPRGPESTGHQPPP